MGIGQTERVETESFASTITDAARLVHRGLPRSSGVELADLVQAGWERVTRYLGSAPTSRTLVFVCAKQGMLEESRALRGLPRDYRAGGVAPKLEGWHEWARITPALPMETLIDIKRTLLAMPLREAASWYSRHMLDEPVGKLGPEFGVCRGRVCQYEQAARAKLKVVALSGDEPRASSARILGTAALRRTAEERLRYRELRDLGASVKQATRNCRSPSLFAAATRALQANAAA